MRHDIVVQLTGWCRQILLPLLLLGVSGCEQKRDVQAVTLVVLGDVKNGRGGVLHPGERVACDERILTGEDGFVVFAPLPGTMICLEARSDFEITAMQMRKLDDRVLGRIVRGNLRAGHVRVWVQPAGSGTIDLRLGIRGGEFRIFDQAMADVATIGPEESRVVCAEGRVVVSGGIELQEGFYTVSEARSFALAQEAAGNEVAWKSLLELRQLEDRLGEVQARQRVLRP